MDQPTANSKQQFWTHEIIFITARIKQLAELTPQELELLKQINNNAHYLLKSIKDKNNETI